MTNSDTSTEASSPSVLTALKQGFSAAFGNLWIAVVFWGVSLLLALLAALPFRSLLLGEAGNSLMVKDLVKGFDYTFLNDFMQNYGTGFTPILNQSLLLLGVQYLLLIFFVGGMVKVLWDLPSEDKRAVFWSGSARYFWRMLRLSLFFLLLHVLVLAVFGFIYLQVTKGLSPKELDSEGIITSSLRWLVPLYVLVAALPMMWQDYAKTLLVADESRWIWRPVAKSIRLIIQNFRLTYFLYLLNGVLVLMVLLANYWLTSLMEIDSSGKILISFLGTQLFVLVRYFFKMLNIGSVMAVLEKTR